MLVLGAGMLLGIFIKGLIFNEYNYSELSIWPEHKYYFLYGHYLMFNKLT